MTLEQKLERVELALARWHTRLARASNAIRKLEKQRRRLRRAAPAEHDVPADGHHALVAIEPHKPDPVDADLGIPPFLDRSNRLTPADEKAIAEIKAKEADRQKQKATASKAKSKARLAGDLRKMPLQGRQALAAIQG